MEFCWFLAVNLYKLLNKYLSCQWFEIVQHWCDMAVMYLFGWLPCPEWLAVCQLCWPYLTIFDMFVANRDCCGTMKVLSSWSCKSAVSNGLNRVVNLSGPLAQLLKHAYTSIFLIWRTDIWSWNVITIWNNFPSWYYYNRMWWPSATTTKKTTTTKHTYLCETACGCTWILLFLLEYTWQLFHTVLLKDIAGDLCFMGIDQIDWLVAYHDKNILKKIRS